MPQGEPIRLHRLRSLLLFGRPLTHLHGQGELGVTEEVAEIVGGGVGDSETSGVISSGVCIISSGVCIISSGVCVIGSMVEITGVSVIGPGVSEIVGGGDTDTSGSQHCHPLSPFRWHRWTSQPSYTCRRHCRPARRRGLPLAKHRHGHCEVCLNAAPAVVPCTLFGESIRTTHAISKTKTFILDEIS
ncbi:unnamed protein product [Chondrus crispus]|uniref:Uncharacterized protein n=1 Tax=Chondrus crispus TaxID=2769 RepID=R7QSV8_CHOCR|nr:unnamed protein product [Chondrus crispus]CDF41224.1 unnamed protein product [Chondrus crispus]|eukprot:XP_005711518.1 unnamed protein product [Chondrus crispus]